MTYETLYLLSLFAVSTQAACWWHQPGEDKPTGGTGDSADKYGYTGEKEQSIANLKWSQACLL